MTLDEFELCFGVLMNHVRMRGLDSVELGKRDLYWHVGSPEWLELYNDPKLSVGFFTHDEAELKKILGEPSRANVVDLERFAHLLLLLSDLLVAQEKFIR